MKTKKILLYSIPILLFICFIVLTLLVNHYDHALSHLGIPATGLESLNSLFPYYNYNELLDRISDVFMIGGLLLMFIVFGMGIYQLISRKGFKYVDLDIYLFGAEIIAMIIIWIFFMVFPVVYRPIYGNVESSFPSTHVLIVTTTYLSISWMICKRFPNKRWLSIVAYSISIVSILATFVLRIVSGMHWFTDCLGAIIIGLTIASLLMIIEYTKKNVSPHHMM